MARHVVVVASMASLIGVFCGSVCAAQGRDSAGVRIVELHVPAHAPPASIVLEPMPSLVIGDDPAGPHERFTDIVALHRLSDGTIVVADNGSQELRFFDSDGEYLRTAGRHGRGPGEFTDIAAFATLPGDSLLVQERYSARVSVFSSKGRLEREFVLGPTQDQRRSQLVGPFPDQTLVGTALDVPPGRGDPPPGPLTVRKSLFAFSSTGTPGRELSSVVERQFQFVAFNGNGTSVARYIRPFGLVGAVVVGGPGYLTGDGSTFEIREYTRDGRLSRILRTDVVGPRITSADKAAEKARILTLYRRSNASELFENFWSSVEWPERMPAFRRFELDPRGQLWIELYTPASDRASRWLIFDRERNLLGAVTLPQNYDIQEIERDGILVISRDDDGVERVLFHAFARVK